MERQRVAISILIVFCIGTILTTVGMFAASGHDQVGTAYNAFYTASMVFIFLSPVVLAVFGREISEVEENQSEAESDGSLL